MLSACIPSVDDISAEAPPPPRPAYPPAAAYPPPEPAPRYPEQDAPQPLREEMPPPSRQVAMPTTARPAWEARPVTPDAQVVATQSYTVAPGDTLRRIAERTGASAEAIARANALEPPFAVQTGQTLTIRAVAIIWCGRARRASPSPAPMASNGRGSSPPMRWRNPISCGPASVS